MSESLFSQGQAALRAGDKQKARQIFQSIVQSNPDNENAWLWLAGATDSGFERALYLERALAINPENERARKALDDIRSKPSEPVLPLHPQPQPVIPILEVKKPDDSSGSLASTEKTKKSVGKKRSTFDKIFTRSCLVFFAILALAALVVWALDGAPALFGGGGGDSVPAIYPVRYEVFGSAYSAKIEYFIGDDESMLGNSILPFSKTVDLEAKDLAYLSAENNGESGSVICQIWVNGKLWKESEKAGAFVKVECEGIVEGHDWPK